MWPVYLQSSIVLGGVSQNLSSVTNDSCCYKLLESLLLIGYQQICHWYLSFVIEKRLCETGPWSLPLVWKSSRVWWEVFLNSSAEWIRPVLNFSLCFLSMTSLSIRHCWKDTHSFPRSSRVARTCERYQSRMFYRPTYRCLLIHCGIMVSSLSCFCFTKYDRHYHYHDTTQSSTPF